MEGRIPGVGEKRAAEEGGVGGEGDGDGLDGFRRKKMRNGEGVSVGAGEKEMKRVAEIVLVLSAMGRMRGGKEPTDVEKVMMAEAREKVVALCEEMAPKDIMPMEAFGGVIEDLGINKLKDVRLGFLPPRLSIAEKMELAKRRITESKALAAQATSHPTQRLQTAGVTAADNCGATTNFHVFPSNRPRSMPAPTAAMPGGHVPSTTPAAMGFHSRSNEIKPSMVSPGLAKSNVGRDLTPAVPSRVESAHYRQDARPGPSFTRLVPVTSLAEQHSVKPIISPSQPPSASLTNTGTKTRTPDHAHTKLEQVMNTSAPYMAPQATNVQTIKPVAQPTPASLPVVQHPVQGAQFVKTASIFNRHVEISKVVQKLLYHKLPERPSWTPPSRDYMTRALVCLMCKMIIGEVDGVLICDACEKGYHLKCLQSFSQTAFPRGEWHCHKCLSITSGKPFPPKYGRVTRNSNPPKAFSNPSAVQSSSSESKVEATDQVVSQPNVMSGNSDKRNLSSHLGTVAESVSNSQSPHDNEMSSALKKDDKPDSELCSKDAAVVQGLTCASPPAQPVLKSESLLNSEDTCKDAAGAKGMTCASPPVGSPNDKPSQLVLKSDTLPCEEEQGAKAESNALVKSPSTTIVSDQMQGSGVQLGEQQDNSNGLHLPLEKSGTNETIDSTPILDPQEKHQDAPQENHVGIVEFRRELSPSRESEDKSQDAEWIGDIHSVDDEKEFYQSCSISGVLYNIQDYALFQLGSEKLVPSKIQAMWEDRQTSSRWVNVNRCYFPTDLPDSVGCPCAPENNEVYESNHDMTLNASSIQGPCEVVAPYKFGDNNRQSNHGTRVQNGQQPMFICKYVLFFLIYE
ncbi:hypothetical protein Dimus_014491 [Dionaea muscipula]